MRSTSSLYSFLLSIFIIALSLPAVSCKPRGLKIKPYPTPRVIASTPSGIQQGDVTLSYTLIEVDGSGSDIALEYSTDGGSTWQAATAKGGSGTTDVKGIIYPGVGRTIVWDSVADVVGYETCRVRIIARKSLSGKTGTPDETGEFEVRNPQVPVISWVSKPEGTVRELPLTFTWQYDTPEYPVQGYFYNLDGQPPMQTASMSVTIPAPPTGQHTFQVYAASYTGNVSNVLEATFTCDNAALNQPPTVVITNGPSGTTTDTKPTFEYIGSDPDGSVQMYFVSIDVDPPDIWISANSWTSSALSCGSHTFYVMAQDNEGKNSTIVSRAFTVIPPAGNQFPSVAITSGPSGTTYDNTPTFEYIGGDPDGYVTGYYVSIDTDPPDIWTTGNSWTSPELPLGPYTFYVVTQDNEGKNSAVVSRSFTVEEPPIQPPTVTILTGPSGTTFDSTPTFTYEGLDNDGTIAGYFVSIDVNPPDVWTTQNSWTSPGLPLGPHTFYVMAQDNDGANSTIATRMFSVILPPGSLIWVKEAQGTSNEQGNSVAVCFDGSILVTGQFYGQVTFGAGEANETSISSAGIYDMFIAKYNSDGTLAWVKRAGGIGHQRGLYVRAHSDGSAYITGRLEETGTFGQGEGNETDLTSAGLIDIFVAKYNADGTFAWAKSAGGTGIDIGEGVSVFPDGSAVVTGYFNDNATFGLGEPGETTLVVTNPSFGRSDVFVAKYNPDGTLAWAKPAGGTEHDRSQAVCTYSNGSAIITGYFRSSAIFGPGEPGQILIGAVAEDTFIAKYNSDGTIAWARNAGVDSNGNGIAALSDGSAILCGYIASPITGWDIYIAKHYSSGGLAWGKRASGNSFSEALDVAAFVDGSSVIIGQLSNTYTFGPGEFGETPLTANGSFDIFVAKYNPNGSLAWAKRAGGSAVDRGFGVTALPDGCSIATGYFGGTATFGAGEAGETQLTSIGGSAFFIAKFSP
ncbi:MAG: hypothetical protein E3J72_06235 [Planctomycetota bacterium]|nr:MAG: hypothetical protein E3J72_06235 [Planctomycetota bacterium]